MAVLTVVILFGVSLIRAQIKVVVLFWIVFFAEKFEQIISMSRFL